jgi:hypothetical protein
MTLPEGLAAASFDRAEQTFSIGLGVVPFLTEDVAFGCASGEPTAKSLDSVRRCTDPHGTASWILSRPFVRNPSARNLAGARVARTAGLNF